MGCVVANGHQVVGLKAAARHIGVGVGVALGVGELARGHPDGGRATGARVGREGGGVLVVAAGGTAAAGHRRKARERAADHIDVFQREGAGVFTQGEGDGLCTARGQAAAARTRHHNGRRCGVGRRVGVGLRVVGDADLVVGVLCTGELVVVLVGVACVVRELACGHTDGGGAGAVG